MHARPGVAPQAPHGGSDRGQRRLARLSGEAIGRAAQRVPERQAGQRERRARRRRRPRGRRPGASAPGRSRATPVASTPRPGRRRACRRTPPAGRPAPGTGRRSAPPGRGGARPRGTIGQHQPGELLGRQDGVEHGVAAALQPARADRATPTPRAGEPRACDAAAARPGRPRARPRARGRTPRNGGPARRGRRRSRATGCADPRRSCGSGARPRPGAGARASTRRPAGAS